MDRGGRIWVPSEFARDHGLRGMIDSNLSSTSGLTGSMMSPGIAELAPHFVLPGSDGKTYDLSDYLGRQTVVLAWFPKAYTPG